jgi:hypothetical protein
MQHKRFDNGMFDSEPSNKDLEIMIIVEHAKELIRQHCHYGWAWIDFVYTSQNKPKLYT